MAANALSVAASGVAPNSSASGFVSILAAGAHLDVVSGQGLVIAAVTVAAILLLSLVSPRIDAQEPPLVKPFVPIIGHLIGIIRHQARYHIFLYRKVRQPIATLPILNGKLYAIWDSGLVAAALRNKDLSLNPFMISMVKPLFLANDDTLALVSDPKEELPNTFMANMAQTLLGDNIRHLNSKTLELLEDFFNRTEHTADVPNLWLWVRGLMMAVTAKALFGEADPFERDPGLESSLWAFQEGLPKLFLGILPAWIEPAGHRARAHIQSALRGYYGSSHDMDSSTAEFVRGRARVLRQFGLSPSEIAKLEIMLPYAASTNTVPTLFWLVTYVFSRPELVATLRGEAALLTTRGGAGGGADQTATINLADIEALCPRLVACYRETLRMTNHQTSVRRVVRNTVLADGRGRSYVLKAGVDVHISIAASHLAEDVWGPTVEEFDPERFLAGGGSGRTQRHAYQPFGGGQHLCPGRNFAFMEIMAVMTTLLVGYDVDSPDGGPWNIPRCAQWSMVDSIHKPVDNGAGLGVKMIKKPGWESVRWRYKM